jgi:hypothetical protein
MDATEATLEAYKEALTDQASYVVNLWADNQFLTANMRYLEYYGFAWPTSASEASFYVFATLLVAKSKWDGQIRTESSIRHMHQQLRRYVESEKETIATGDGVRELEQVVATFSSCCDLVKDNEDKTAAMTTDGAQRWFDEQDRLWNAAKDAYQSQFNVDSEPPIQHIRLINDLADTWRAQKEAERDKLTAQAAANVLV